jgi:hypothetical protein
LREHYFIFERSGYGVSVTVRYARKWWGGKNRSVLVMEGSAGSTRRPLSRGWGVKFVIPLDDLSKSTKETFHGMDEESRGVRALSESETQDIAEILVNALSTMQRPATALER